MVSGRHPAVLLIGCSEGGQPGVLLPHVLASRGYPVLALAYFKAPGLPKTLSRIPLEYFASALRWLAQQPGVNSQHMVVDGASRGGEAALLIGATYPALVHGVVAGVPSSVALCSYPGCTGPAWTLGGKAVPFTSQFDQPHPTDNPTAAIPVERIQGPVLLNCAGHDQVWTSCPYAQAVMLRLARSTYPDHLETCATCDHYVGAGTPDEPRTPIGATAEEYADSVFYPNFFHRILTLLGPPAA